MSSNVDIIFYLKPLHFVYFYRYINKGECIKKEITALIYTIKIAPVPFSAPSRDITDQ